MADATLRGLQRLISQGDISLLPLLIHSSLRSDAPQTVDPFVGLLEEIDPYLVWEWKLRRNDFALAQNELPMVDFDIKLFFSERDAMLENLGQDWSRSISDDFEYAPFEEGGLRRHLRRFYFSNGFGVSIVYASDDPWPGDARAINTDLPHRIEVAPVKINGPFPQDGPTSPSSAYPENTIFTTFYPIYPQTDNERSILGKYITRIDVDDTQGLIDIMTDVASWS